MASSRCTPFTPCATIDAIAHRVHAAQAIGGADVDACLWVTDARRPICDLGEDKGGRRIFNECHAQREAIGTIGVAPIHVEVIGPCGQDGGQALGATGLRRLLHGGGGSETGGRLVKEVEPKLRSTGSIEADQRHTTLRELKAPDPINDWPSGSGAQRPARPGDPRNLCATLSRPRRGSREPTQREREEQCQSGEAVHR